MTTVHTFAGTRSASHGTVGLVPTMGYLHEGHLELIEIAARRSDTVVVSVFVNPLQFGDPDDLDSYPIDLPRDVALAVEAGADVVFAPDVDEMYRARNAVRVVVPGVGDAMEGVHRPGHFDGVATVVAKLFAGIRPDLAFFGRKDAQQLALVTTMAAGLSMPVEVVGCPTVRESDGLALSSRNTRLSGDARAHAPHLHAALLEAAESFARGERRARELTRAAYDRIEDVPDISIEYIEAADAMSAEIVDEIDGLCFVALAATVGGVRLIDNVFLDGRDGSVDVGVRLETKSILYGGSSCS